MIKLKKAYGLLIIFLLLAANGMTQNNNFTCPWDEVNCLGKCGSFYDANNDGYCDYGRVETPEIKDSTPVIIPETTNVVTNEETGSENNSTLIDTIQTENKIDSINTDTVSADDSKNIDKTNNTAQKPPSRRPYTLLFITTLVFGFYFLTYFLSKTKKLRKLNHRRIWNILLALTFLGSGVLGIVLVIQLNYNIWISIYREFLYWHVEFGIAMGLIGILHALWHWKYFKNIFNGWKNKNQCN